MRVIASDFETGKAYVNRETEEHIIILGKLHAERGPGYIEVMISRKPGRYWRRVIDWDDFLDLIRNDVLIPLFPTQDRGPAANTRTKQTITINISL